MNRVNRGMRFYTQDLLMKHLDLNILSEGEAKEIVRRIEIDKKDIDLHKRHVRYLEHTIDELGFPIPTFVPGANDDK